MTDKTPEQEREQERLAHESLSRRHMKALNKADKKLTIETDQGPQINNKNAVMLVANHVQIVSQVLKMLASQDNPRHFEVACTIINDALEDPLVRNNLLNPRIDIAKAELDRRGATVHDRKVEISGHAIDSASLRVRKTWHEDRGKDEGLHAWLVRICEKALEEHEIDEKGRIEINGMRLVFDQGEIYPTLKTVIPLKGKKVKE